MNVPNGFSKPTRSSQSLLVLNRPSNSDTHNGSPRKNTFLVPPGRSKLEDDKKTVPIATTLPEITQSNLDNSSIDNNTNKKTNSLGNDRLASLKNENSPTPRKFLNSITLEAPEKKGVLLQASIPLNHISTPQQNVDLWLSRWAVLKDGCLFICESQKDTKPILELSLSGAKVRECSNFQFSFEIQCNTLPPPDLLWVFKLPPGDEFEYFTWIISLRGATHYLRTLQTQKKRKTVIPKRITLVIESTRLEGLFEQLENSNNNTSLSHSTRINVSFVQNEISTLSINNHSTESPLSTTQGITSNTILSEIDTIPQTVGRHRLTDAPTPLEEAIQPFNDDTNTHKNSTINLFQSINSNSNNNLKKNKSIMINNRNASLISNSNSNSNSTQSYVFTRAYPSKMLQDWRPIITPLPGDQFSGPPILFARDDNDSDTENSSSSRKKRGCLMQYDQGLIFSTWKMRWVVMDNSSFMIYSSKEDEEINAMPLYNIEILFCSARVIKDREKDRYPFEIVTNNRSFIMGCTTGDEMLEWINCLQTFQANKMQGYLGYHKIKAENPDRMKLGEGELDELEIRILYDIDLSKQQLQNVVEREENKFCADCDSPDPLWASINLGIFLCIQCSGIHRQLGVHISKVRSITMDKWEPKTISLMGNLGNRVCNLNYEANLPVGRKPLPDASPQVRETFIKEKYVMKLYCKIPT